MPATMWLVYHIISDPTVLADCREELTRTLNKRGELDVEAAGDAVQSIDIDYIRRQRPVLLSTFKKIFRYHGVGISSRVILEDQLLDDRFLPMKDNIPPTPGVVQHKERSVWGEDVDKFLSQALCEWAERQQGPPPGKGCGPGHLCCSAPT